MEAYQKFKAYRSAMWLIITAVYFLISFGFGMWRFSWLIFLLGAVIEQVVKGAFLEDSDTEQPGTHREERKNAYASAMWLIIVVLFFVLSFATGAWYITWIIFLIGAALNPIIRANIK